MESGRRRAVVAGDAAAGGGGGAGEGGAGVCYPQIASAFYIHRNPQLYSQVRAMHMPNVIHVYLFY